MKTLFIAWQDPIIRRWFPVGRLTYDGSTYGFVYTMGAKESPNFGTFPMMKNFDSVYESNNLFPVFSNLILSKSRPEYKQYLDWLGLEREDVNPLKLLAVSGGIRETDSFELFACPERTTDGKYATSFFSHGISFLSQDVIKRVEELRSCFLLSPL